MKVITPKTMLQMETLAYKQGASERAFMESAGTGIAHAVDAFITKHDLAKKVLLVCGKGNNGGDAYVAGVHLLAMGYSVSACQGIPIEQCSPLCQENNDRFYHAGGHTVLFKDASSLQFPSGGVILDGIFGTGFHGKVEEPFASLIQAINHSHLPVIAVDIPSGLNGETGEVESLAIKAAETIFLGLPKMGFFLRDGWNYVGTLTHVDFGLNPSYIDQAQANLSLINADMAAKWLPSIQRTRHKYQAGHVVGLAGSPGYPGAAILSSYSALCGGAGIVHLLFPEGMQTELSNAPSELIKVPYELKQPQPLFEMFQKASAIFVGPGLGRSLQVSELLKNILPKIEKPCVIDADALTILAEENIVLPPQTVLTPHTGEMQRLLHDTSHPVVDEDYLKRCQEYADKQNVTLVLKGGPSFIFHPNTQVLVNPTGNPGMATAGSGDVLTGLIAALLAQGLSCREAAALGVYLHGRAGDYAAMSMTEYCLVASDITHHFPEAFSELLIIRDHGP